MDDEESTGLSRAERKAAEVAAKVEAARAHHARRLVELQVRREAKAAARAQEKTEALERDRARERAKEEAKAVERAGPPDHTGKQRLIDAAMRLHGEKRSFASLGIREIAREANLNPNTFYRHFESIDDLAVAAVAQIGERLRPMLHQIQRLASRVDPMAVVALEVSAFYAFALGNAEAIVVGVTEYHGGSPRVRASIAAMLTEIAGELRDDMTDLGILPTMSPEHRTIACEQIVTHLFHLSQEYVERPERRDAIVEASEFTIVWMFVGAALAGTVNLASIAGLPNAAG